MKLKEYLSTEEDLLKVLTNIPNASCWTFECKSEERRFVLSRHRVMAPKAIQEVLGADLGVVTKVHLAPVRDVDALGRKVPNNNPKLRNMHVHINISRELAYDIDEIQEKKDIGSIYLLIVCLKKRLNTTSCSSYLCK
jgi:hypothetical protein